MTNKTEIESIGPLKYQLKQWRRLTRYLPDTDCDRDDVAEIEDLVKRGLQHVNGDAHEIIDNLLTIMTMTQWSQSGSVHLQEVQDYLAKIPWVVDALRFLKFGKDNGEKTTLAHVAWIRRILDD